MQNKLKLNLANIPKWIPIVLLIIAIIGFADATYISIESFNNKIPPCTTDGCETVLTSEYAKILGVPVSYYGAIYYFIIMIMIFSYLDTKKEIFLRIPIILSVLGLLFSIWFMTVMIFIIKAICPYCILSAISSITIFIISLFTYINYREKIQNYEKTI